MSRPRQSSRVGKSRLQELLDELSHRFLAPDFNHIDQVIVEAQQAMVRKLGLDRSSLWQMNGPQGQLILTHIWQKAGWPQVPVGIAAKPNLPWSLRQVEMGAGFHFSRLSDLPPEAEQDRAAFAIYGPRSNVTVPLIANGKVFGALAFASLRKEHHWTKEELAEIRLLGRIFAHILAQVRAHEHLSRLEDELARRSRLSLMGEFASTLVHEISQPLSSIASNAGALRLHHTPPFPEELLAIEDDTRRAGQILNHLRGLLGKDTTPMEPLPLNPLLDEVLAMMSARLHAQSIETRILFPEDLPWVRAAAVEIRMVLANLLRNATDAMVGQESEKTVEITAIHRGRWIWIQVEDTGPGIAPKLREKIFEPLFTTRPGGTGMGLAICRRVVAAHGGQIKASRRRSGGARLEFSLPVAR